MFEYAKNHWTAYFKRVSFMAYELYLNKAAKKEKRKRYGLAQYSKDPVNECLLKKLLRGEKSQSKVKEYLSNFGRWAKVIALSPIYYKW